MAEESPSVREGERVHIMEEEEEEEKKAQKTTSPRQGIEPMTSVS